MTDNTLVPSYSIICTECGALPVVAVENKDGKIIHNFELCGACFFGGSDYSNPVTWWRFNDQSMP